MKKFLFLCGLLLAHFQALALSPAVPVIRDIEPADTLCVMNLDTYHNADYGLVSYKNHFLLLDKQGHWHILGKINPEKFGGYACSQTLAMIEQNNQWYIYDGETGKPFKPNNQPIEDVSLNIDFSRDVIALKQQGKWSAWQKKNGKLIQITPNQYDNLYAGNTFSSKLYDDNYTADDIQYFQAALNGKWGVIDRKGNWIVPAQYAEGKIMLYRNLITIQTQDNVESIIDFSGNKIVELNTNQFEPFYYSELNGIVIKDKKTEKYGLMNLQGKWVLPLEYDWIGEPEFKRTLILKNKLEGFINENGKIVIPMAFDSFDNSNLSRGGFFDNDHHIITAKNIGNCSLYVDTRGVLIDDDFFKCYIDEPATYEGVNIDKLYKEEKLKAIKLLKSRGYPIKWRKLPENIDTVQPPKLTVVRDPLPDLPDVVPASEPSQTISEQTSDSETIAESELTWWEKIKQFFVNLFNL